MAIVARSVAAVEDQVSLPQLRILVMLATRGPLNIAAVADALAVHPSNATRAVDRLVSAKLVDRRDDQADRRNVALTLTARGRNLVDSIFDHRRAAIEQVVARMSEAKRRALTSALESFAEAADEIPEHAAADLDWTH